MTQQQRRRSSIGMAQSTSDLRIVAKDVEEDDSRYEFYQPFMSSFSLFIVWLCIFFVKENWLQSCSQNVGEIDYTYEFHQSFMSICFVQKLF